MNDLGSYFQKIRRLINDKSTERHAIIKAIKDTLEIDIEEKDIQGPKDGVVYINGSSSLKNAIFLRKKEILDLCETQGLKVNDLR